MVFSNRDQRTLLDKIILLIDSLGLKEPAYFVADAYDAIGKHRSRAAGPLKPRGHAGQKQ